MPILSGMMRQVAITGSSDRITAWCADRQGREWAERTVRAAFPQQRAARPVAAVGRAAAIDRDVQLRTLNDLRERGLVDEDEFRRLRDRL